jgi:hypothetical protein
MKIIYSFMSHKNIAENTIILNKNMCFQGKEQKRRNPKIFLSFERGHG